MTNKGNPNIREISKKSTGPRTIEGIAKQHMNRSSHQIGNTQRLGRLDSSFNRALLDKGFDPRDKRAFYVKQMFASWAKTIRFKDMNELIELENTFNVVKQSLIKTIYNKLSKEQKLSPDDMYKLKFLVDTGEKLYKLKYGTKLTKEVRTVDYKDVMHWFDKKMKEEKKRGEEKEIEAEREDN